MEDSAGRGSGIDRSGRDLKCPECGAKNKLDAQWCWQCLERFPEPDPSEGEGDAGAPETVPGSQDTDAPPATLRREAMSELAGIAGDEDVAARISNLLTETPLKPSSSNGHSDADTASRPEAEAVIEGKSGAIAIKGEAITWTCSRCDSVNDFDRNICSVCGASFGEIIKEPELDRPKRDPNTVAMVSLFFPGAGHAYLGLWGQAIARGVISVWVVVTAIFAAAQGATQSTIMAVVFGLFSFGLWAVSAHDAYREASNQPSRVLLRDRVFLYVVLGLLMLSVVMVFSLAMGARA